jgi:flotillin
MIEKIQDIVAKQVEAIKNIKFDKITVWDGGAGSANGSTTANFMRDLIKSLPAMHDLANQAGIELPSVLGKVDNGLDDIKVSATPAKPKPQTPTLKKEDN